MLEFAKKEYEHFLYLDFSRVSSRIKELFREELADLDQFFMELEAATRVHLPREGGLIIFDEVQMFPKARESNPASGGGWKTPVYGAGSLISLHMNVSEILIPSEEEHLCLYPMDFEEFLWAQGDENSLRYVEECFHDRKPLGAAAHRGLTKLFRQYLLVGGMPEAVRAFVTNKLSLKHADAVKRQILTLYRNDIAQFARGYEAKVRSLFDEIPSQLQRHDKKFKLAALGQTARFRTYENALLWLSDAMMVNNCYSCTEPNVGLRLRRERHSFKCYMGDTGLLIAHAFDENELMSSSLYDKLLQGKLEVNEGMIGENMVAQMLRAAGHQLYFYTCASREHADERMEIDFLTVKHNVTNWHNVCPIEVKTGRRYALSSLKKFLNKFAGYVDTPYVVHDGDFRVEDGIVYIPFYAVPFL